jgi:hypothetical protein
VSVSVKQNVGSHEMGSVGSGNPTADDAGGAEGSSVLIPICAAKNPV